MYKIILVICFSLITTHGFGAESETKKNNTELQLFSKVLEKVRSDYVEVPSDTQLAGDSIESLFTNLDLHSTYLDKDEFKKLQTKTTGNPGGLGIEIATDNQVIRVISMIDGSPASAAGILTGDQIVTIDYLSINSMELEKITEKLRGKQGSEIILGVQRGDQTKRLEYTLVRELAPTSSVRSQMLKKGIGYIRIAVFQAETSEEFKSAINQLQTDGPLQGLVLDLRNNPGGLMPISVEVADSLIDQGLLLYTEGRLPSANKQYYATYGDLLNGAPIVVLINDGSASASEIVAGALQDQERATIVGTQSFGKGSVQSVTPLPDGSAIKLTTAHYLTPSGRSIHGQGIKPDRIIEPATNTTGYDPQLKEAVDLLLLDL